MVMTLKRMRMTKMMTMMMTTKMVVSRMASKVPPSGHLTHGFTTLVTAYVRGVVSSSC